MERQGVATTPVQRRRDDEKTEARPVDTLKDFFDDVEGNLSKRATGDHLTPPC